MNKNDAIDSDAKAFEQWIKSGTVPTGYIQRVLGDQAQAVTPNGLEKRHRVIAQGKLNKDSARVTEDRCRDTKNSSGCR